MSTRSRTPARSSRVDLSRLSDLRHSGREKSPRGVRGRCEGARPRGRAPRRAASPSVTSLSPSSYSTLGGLGGHAIERTAVARLRTDREALRGGPSRDPAGTLDLAVFPASAAGPDLREIVLGSRGEVRDPDRGDRSRHSRSPNGRSFSPSSFPDFGTGSGRHAPSRPGPPSPFHVAPRDAGGDRGRRSSWPVTRDSMTALWRGICGFDGKRESKCLLLVGLSGRREDRPGSPEADARNSRDRMAGVYVGNGLRERWLRSRFFAPYLRNALWDAGYAVDTVETAAPLEPPSLSLRDGVEGALSRGASWRSARASMSSLICRISISDGSSLYTTYLFRLAEDPDENLRPLESLLKAAASRVDQGRARHDQPPARRRRRTISRISSPRKRERGRLGPSILFFRGHSIRRAS